MSEAPPRDDPRFRTHRAVVLSVYLALSVGFCGLIIVSVVRSVLAMSPLATPVGVALSPAECGTQLRGLFRELEQHRRDVANELRPTEVDRTWVSFRAGWVQRFTALRGQCAGVAQPPLAQAFAQVERYMAAATVNAVQFSTDVGPVLEATRVALDALDR